MRGEKNTHSLVLRSMQCRPEPGSAGELVGIRVESDEGEVVGASCSVYLGDICRALDFIRHRHGPVELSVNAMWLDLQLGPEPHLDGEPRPTSSP